MCETKYRTFRKNIWNRKNALTKLRNCSTELCRTWGISNKFQKKVDLPEIQNAANNKRHLPSLSNKDFHNLQNPKISSPINHKTKIHTFKIIKSPMILMKLKIKPVFQEIFSQNNQTNYNPTEVMRPWVDSFIDQLIEGKETVLDTSSPSFIVQDILKQELVPSLAPNKPVTFQWEPRGMTWIHWNFFLSSPSKIFLWRQLAYA